MHPLLRKRTPEKNILIVVVTSDRGLCGAFNTNIVRAARKKADDLVSQGKTVFFYIVGRKGRPVIQRLYSKSIIAQFDGSGTPGVPGSVP